MTPDEAKIVGWNKAEDSLTSVAICSLPWGLLTQYYECNSEIYMFHQETVSGILLAVTESWQKDNPHQEQLGLFLTEKQQDYGKDSLHD